jgi:tRNA-intron endonuclease
MEITFDGQLLRAGTEARERFYDSRGYGRPRDGALELAPVEAAHLLFRGDIEHVLDRRERRERRLDFGGLLASTAVSEVSFFVYKDLRDRGFYLSPVRDPADSAGGPMSRPADDSAGRSMSGPADDGTGASGGEFVVYPRGQGPWDDAVAYRVRAVSEREDIAASALRALVERATAEGATAVLAVVDEESEVTYLELTGPDIAGATDHGFPAVRGRLLSDRVLVGDPPGALYERAFYGQQLDPDGPVQLSLVEAAHLADRGLLALDGEGTDAGSGADTRPGDGVQSEPGEPGQRLRERGRAVEGARFDRRLRVYSTLRDAGVVPKTGFKFGADFRTYAEVESVDELGHSELLVRVLPGGHVFSPRDLALDVRLAHGVRKRMVFALAGEELWWLAAERLTP